MRFHFGRNEVFPIQYKVNLLQLFTWNTLKWNNLHWLLHCGHFGRIEISFPEIKLYVETIWNEIIREETSTYVSIKEKGCSNCLCGIVNVIKSYHTGFYCEPASLGSYSCTFKYTETVALRFSMNMLFQKIFKSSQETSLSSFW